MDCDLVVGIRETVANAAVDVLYRKKPKNLFSGSANFQDKQVTWDVTEVPRVVFRGFTDEERKNAITRDQPTTPRQDSLLVVEFPCVAVQIGQQAGQETVRQINVECSLVVHQNSLTVVPLAATLDTTGLGEWTVFAFRGLVVPEALALAGGLAGAIPLPHIKVDSVAFGDIALRIGGGLLVGATCLVEDGARLAVPDPSSLPDSPFFVLVSPRAVQQAAQSTLDTLRSASQEMSGKVAFGIGDAWYHAGVSLDSATATVEPAQPQSVDVRLRFGAYAYAQVDIKPLDAVQDGFKKVGDTVAHVFSSY